MEYGIQIAALAMILTITFSFFQHKRIPMLSTRMFTGFLLLALFNILAEFTTLYTLGHIETVPPAVNRFCHQLFIGSLILMALFMFLYVDMKARRQRRYRPGQLLIRSIPALAALLMVVFGRLEYYTGPDGRYSHGPMAMAVYVAMPVYMLMILLRLRRAGEHFFGQERTNLLCGIGVWIGIAVVQFFNPTMLLSSLGVGLMVAFVYISYENPREYQDRELPEVMNRYAFGMALSELLQRGSVFYVVSMLLTNVELLRSTYGYSGFAALMQEESGRVLGNTGGTRFYVGEYMISAVFTGEEYRAWRQQWEARGGGDESGGPRFQMLALECPRYAADRNAVLDLLEFVSTGLGDCQQKSILEIDGAWVEKMRYFGTVDQLLQTALHQDGLEVYYQPIYSTEKKAFLSAEALVRLKDTQTAGFVSPEVFIPMAEKAGIIRELGETVFEQVCRFAAEQDLRGRGVAYVEVNLSGAQAMDEKLAGTLLDIAGKYGVEPGFINLEMTETVAVQAGARLTANMEKLRAAGCRFSVDDFGTGYSNLSQIAACSFELIKLDKSLLWPCFTPDGEKAGVVLDACIDMVHRLGCGIVAEGVETQEQAALLMDRGVEHLQGYYYAKPMPQAAYLEFLEAQRGN